MQNHESSPTPTETPVENPWDSLSELSEKSTNENTDQNETKLTVTSPIERQAKISQAASKVRAVFQKQKVSPTETSEPKPSRDHSDLTTQEAPHPSVSTKKSPLAQTIAAKYAANERPRVERLKSSLNDYYNVTRYEMQEIATEPTPFKKALRMFTDKLGIKTKRDEKQREREAMHTALTEYRAEEAAKDQALKEQLAQREAQRIQREAEYQAERARQEQAIIAKEMSTARDVFERHKHESFMKQRVQEIIERDLNSKLLTVDTLETEVLSENPEIEKRFVTFEDTEIPVYDLKGLPFSVLSTTIDYRNANKPGDIGTETYKNVMEDPSIWNERRDQAEKVDGFGTRNANARGDTISASYYNSERNIDSRVPGDLIYGFEKVTADSIITIANGDGATNNMAGRAETSLTNPDALKNLEGANGTYMYNEVLLRRYSENGIPKRPDFIIAENGRITEAALRHAKFFKVPIVNIERRVYTEKAHARGKELLKSINENDSYQEIDHKLADLLSISEYKTAYRTLEGIGRSYDIPQLLNGSTTLEEECLEVSKMEQLKRLDFIADTLEAATQELKTASEKGLPKPPDPPQFDFFEIELQDIANQTRSSKYGKSRESFYSVPGNCNWIEVSFRLKGSSRIVKTRIYDGQRVFKLEEALQTGARKAEDLENADSSFYDKLAPIVQDYLAACQESMA